MTAAQAISQSETDAQNRDFWTELCGTQLARSIGVEDDSPESLQKFDDWYFQFYPYLRDHIPFDELGGKRVLEVGLGYGSVAQKIIESGAVYEGLDIADGPVGMVRNRASRLSVPCEVTQGSILEHDLENGTYDWVIAIGCLHHTGDLERAIAEVYSLLKSGGKAVIMVYNAASYRQWATSPLGTLKAVSTSPRSYRAGRNADDRARAMYDVNEAGKSAPQTEFVTAAQLKSLCRAFRNVHIKKENIGGESLLRFFDRHLLCKLFGKWVGLDLYCALEK